MNERTNNFPFWMWRSILFWVKWRKYFMCRDDTVAGTWNNAVSSKYCFLFSKLNFILHSDFHAENTRFRPRVLACILVSLSKCDICCAFEIARTCWIPLSMAYIFSIIKKVKWSMPHVLVNIQTAPKIERVFEIDVELPRYYFKKKVPSAFVLAYWFDECIIIISAIRSTIVN